MIKIDKAVREETIYIGMFILILSLLLQSVFLIIGQWNLSVLYGNLLSGAAAILNFFLMGLTVQHAVEKDQKQAAAAMKLSQALRTLMLFAVAAIGVLLPCFSTWTALIPLFFPRIAFAFQPLFLKRKNEGSEPKE